MKTPHQSKKYSTENSSKITENSSEHFSNEKMPEKIVLQLFKAILYSLIQKEFSDGVF